MCFLTVSKVDIYFEERKLVWKTYITEETLLTTRRVEIINKKEFVVALLNTYIEIFIVHIVALA